MSRRRCCCCVCSNCDGATPQSLELTMSGWAGAFGCTTCGTLNDTFILTCAADIPAEDLCSPAADCGAEWAYLFPSPFCDLYGIFLKLLYTEAGWEDVPAGHYFLLLHIGCREEQFEYLYMDLGTEKPNCSTANWGSFIYLWGSVCDGSAVTASVTIPS